MCRLIDEQQPLLDEGGRRINSSSGSIEEQHEAYLLGYTCVVHHLGSINLLQGLLTALIAQGTHRGRERERESMKREPKGSSTGMQSSSDRPQFGEMFSVAFKFLLQKLKQFLFGPRLQVVSEDVGVLQHPAALRACTEQSMRRPQAPGSTSISQALTSKTWSVAALRN